MVLNSVLDQAGPGMVILAELLFRAFALPFGSRAPWWLSLSHGECDHTCIHVLMQLYELVSITVIHMHTYGRMVSHQVFSFSINYCFLFHRLTYETNFPLPLNQGFTM